MPTGSVFTQMMRGDLPARFVWNDDLVVALLSNTPLNAGHTLVVPRREVDHWIDLEPDLLHHLMEVSRDIAQAMHVAFRPVKVGMVIAGIEVRHVHIHLVPIDAVRDLNFEHQELQPDPARLDADADRIRNALRGRGPEDRW
ncbi:MAG TPA: HIT family protein [Longimicrobiales bacterium]|nr:HIT family protein [Longimicrobiales bacterium]